MSKQLGHCLHTDVGLVVGDLSVCILYQEFAADSRAIDAGRSQFEIEDEAASDGQEMELGAEVEL